MGIFSGTFEFIAGLPAVAGLLLTAAIIFLTSDWRLSLASLLAQYMLVGLTLTRFLQAELAIVKILVGVLAAAILYLSARYIRDEKGASETGTDDRQFLGLQVGWQAGPLGLPLRLLTLIMVFVAAIHFFDAYRSLLPVPGGESAAIPPDIAFVSMWLAATGVIGLSLSGDPVRVAPAMLTILTGFELVYALLEPGLAVVGFLAALTLMAALALAYLTTVRGLSERLVQEESRTAVQPEATHAPVAPGDVGGEG